MQNLIDLSKRNLIKKFIHVSSVVVYGLHSGKEVHEVHENLDKEGKTSWDNVYYRADIGHRAIAREIA